MEALVTDSIPADRLDPGADRYIGDHRARHRARRYPRCRLACRRAPAAAIIAKTVFGVIGVIGMAGAIRLGDLRIILRALIDILDHQADRSEEHTSELQSLMRISYAVFCLK